LLKSENIQIKMKNL